MFLNTKKKKRVIQKKTFLKSKQNQSTGGVRKDYEDERYKVTKLKSRNIQNGVMANEVILLHLISILNTSYYELTDKSIRNLKNKYLNIHIIS